MTEIRLSKKEISNRLNSIRIKPEGLTNRKYGVSVKYFEGDEKQPFKRIDYELNLELKIHYNQGFLEINKTNIYYNQHESDAINEIIADSISKSLYPLQVELNEKGLTPNEILNYSEVLERWNSEKEKITEKYQSDALRDFFNTVDLKFLHQKQIERSLQNDWFWNLFFHPRLVNYGDYRMIDTYLYLAVIPYQNPIRFIGTQKIEKMPTDYHSFTIGFQSVEQNAPDYFRPKNDTEEITFFMKLNVFFDLDIYHHFPMHIRADFKIYKKDRFGTETILNRTEFSQYQQNTEEYQSKQLSIDIPFITGGLVKLPPNKWGFDNFENLEYDW